MRMVVHEFKFIYMQSPYPWKKLGSTILAKVLKAFAPGLDNLCPGPGYSEKV